MSISPNSLTQVVSQFSETRSRFLLPNGYAMGWPSFIAVHEEGVTIDPSRGRPDIVKVSFNNHPNPDAYLKRFADTLGATRLPSTGVAMAELECFRGNEIIPYPVAVASVYTELSRLFGKPIVTRRTLHRLFSGPAIVPCTATFTARTGSLWRPDRVSLSVQFGETGFVTEDMLARDVIEPRSHWPARPTGAPTGYDPEISSPVHSVLLRLTVDLIDKDLANKPRGADVLDRGVEVFMRPMAEGSLNLRFAEEGLLSLSTPLVDPDLGIMRSLGFNPDGSTFLFDTDAWERQQEWRRKTPQSLGLSEAT